MAQQQDLMLKMLEQMREDMAQDREASRQSRTAMHSRTDELIERVGRVETSVGISGQIDAQVRSELDQLKTLVQRNRDEIQPTVDAWERILSTGNLTARAFSIAGITTIGALVTAVATVTGVFDALWHWVLRLLRV